MKKLILLSLFFSLVGSITFGQDVIIKENGEEIKSKVVEVGKAEIKYKNFDDPEFTTYSVPINEVKKIRYENGTEKKFKRLIKHYIGFNIGKSIAFSDYQSTENEKAGYAKSGSLSSLDYGFYLAKNFGIAGTMGLFSNKQDTNAIKQSFNNTNVRLGFENDQKWKGGFFFIGPQYSFRIGKRFSIDAKILVGVLSLRKPSFRFDYGNATGNYFLSYREGRGSNFAFNIGTSLRYDFSKRFAVRFVWEIIKSQPGIHYEVDISEPGSPDTRTEGNKLKQDVDIIKAGLGLVFLLNR